MAVVENDESVRKSLERLLRATGYESATFTSAESFLQSSLRNSVDCLVLDINLDGMSGIELYKMLLDGAATPPVIFISGRNDDATVFAAKALGCVDYLRKPFESQALLRAIEAALDRDAQA